MLQADDLLKHATRLLAYSASTEIDYRRAVSASYYSVFHLISAAVAAQMSPSTPLGLRARSQRALEHRAMKNAMASFLTPESLNKFSKEIGIPCVYSRDIAEVARAFGELQDARHLADYDVIDFEGKVGLPWALECVNKAGRVFEAWDRANSAEIARVFLASMILGNKWAK